MKWLRFFLFRIHTFQTYRACRPLHPTWEKFFEFGLNSHYMDGLDTTNTYTFIHITVALTLRMVTINLQCISRKTSFVHDIISENNLSFLTATELLHTTSLDIPLLRAVPQGFSVIDQPRPVDPSSTKASRTNHNGVAIFYGDRFSGKRLNLDFSPQH